MDRTLNRFPGRVIPQLSSRLDQTADAHLLPKAACSCLRQLLTPTGGTAWCEADSRPEPQRRARRKSPSIPNAKSETDPGSGTTSAHWVPTRTLSTR